METGKSFPANVDKTSQKTPEKKPTLRFTLTLAESTDDKNPEFSFTELTRTAKGEKIPLEKGPWDDDYEDEQLKQLAKKFEEKYGPKGHSKKKIRDRIEDLIDVGYGYDETDPFVDNSEAYDELISADWTTEHGGFYINQGVLHFKRVKEDEESDHEFKVPKKKKGPKKLKDPNLKFKKLKESGEKKRKFDKENKEKKPKRIRLSSDAKEKEKKHKKKHGLSGKLSGTKPQPLPVSAVISSSTATEVSSSSSPPVNNSSAVTDSVPGTPSGQTDSALSSSPDENLVRHVKTEPVTTQSDTLRNENVTNASNIEGSLGTGVSQNGPQNDSSSNIGAQGSAVAPVPKLPPGLSSALEDCVRQLKEAAESCLDGKCKFFNRDVNNLLLEVETSARELSCRVRSGIYEYLAVYLPCSKETIQKRAKKLLLTDQNGRLREPMAKLKAAVDRIMPEQEKRFQEEVQKHVEEQSQNSTGKTDEVQKDLLDQKELFQSAMAIQDESEATTPTEPNAPGSVQDKTKSAAPKRKFIWNGELRKLLCDVVQMKLKLYEMAKTRTQSAEDYLKGFFEAEVRPLWPKGWMTTRILYRESRQAHHDITNLPAKAKKPVQSTKKSVGKPGETSESQESTGEETNIEHKPVNAVAMVSSPMSAVAKPIVSESSPSSVADVKLPSSVAAQTLNPPRSVIISTTTSSVLQRPIVTMASATHMESTLVTRTETKPSVVTQILTRPFVSLTSTNAASSNTVTLVRNDAKLLPTTEIGKSSLKIKLADIQKAFAGQKTVCESKPVREPVTILDFANLIPSELMQKSKLPSESNSTKPLQHLPVVSKTSSTSPSKSYSSLVYTPQTSVQTNTSIISPPRTQTISAAQPAVAQVVKTASQAKEPALTNEKLFAVLARNNLMNLQPTSVGASVAIGTAGTVSGPSSVHNTVQSPQHRPADVGVLKTSPGHTALPVAAMNMSLSTSTPSSVMHQTVGVPSIPMFNPMDLQGKMPNALNQLGRAPHLGHPAMIQLARQPQEQHGILLPQNVFSQVLMGLSQQPSTDTANPPTTSIPLSHSPILPSNPNLFQDPNRTNPNGGTQSNSSQFLPRFNS